MQEYSPYDLEGGGTVLSFKDILSERDALDFWERYYGAL